MNFKKIILGLVLILSTSAFSQKWAETQGDKLVEKLNTSLVESNDNLKLNDDQTAKIATIYKDLMILKSEEKKKLEKEGTFSKKTFWEATFPLQKDANVKIKEVLSAEQSKAFNTILQKK